MVHLAEIGQLLVRENWMLQAESAHLLRGRFEKVALGADETAQGHDHLFAYRIDRRVGDLREQLLEVVVNHAWLVGQAGQRRVVTHGAQRITRLGDQRNKHELHGFGGITECLHALEGLRVIQRRRRCGAGYVGQRDSLLREPFPVGSFAGDQAFHFFVRNESALIEVDQKHFARLQAPFEFNVGRIDLQHTDFGCHDALVIVGDVIAARPQSVAVKHGTNVFAVREHN